MSAALFLAFSGCGPPREPFYMKDVEALKKLPEADLLKMRDNILAQAADLPDTVVTDGRREGGAILDAADLAATGPGAVAGKAELRKDADGLLWLCLVDFHVTQAPDLQVEYAMREKFTHLASLQGNAGFQCFVLPAAAKGIRRVRIRSGIFDQTFAEAGFSKATDVE